MKGSELKQMFREKAGNPKGRVRIFCVGQEILDNVPLAKYELAENFVMISKIMT